MRLTTNWVPAVLFDGQPSSLVGSRRCPSSPAYDFSIGSIGRPIQRVFDLFHKSSTHALDAGDTRGHVTYEHERSYLRVFAGWGAGRGRRCVVSDCRRAALTPVSLFVLRCKEAYRSAPPSSVGEEVVPLVIAGKTTWSALFAGCIESSNPYLSS